MATSFALHARSTFALPPARVPGAGPHRARSGRNANQRKEGIMAEKTRWTKFAQSGRRRAEQNRRIQAHAEELRKQREQQESQQDDKKPVQVGARKYAEPPLPEQHLQKPGIEADLKDRPEYEAPHYTGSGKLTGKVALITGGDSGIGRAVAVLYAREGADVAIVYLDEDEDAEETQRAVEAEGRQCLLIPGDVSDSGFCLAAVEHVVQEFGRLDILVNNAAFQESQLSIEDITDDQLETTFRTNIFGYFFMTRAALPHLKEGAVILNTGSITGENGHKELLDYAATKGAIHNFTKSLSMQLLPKGIRVNAVAPGPVWTPLNPADSDAKDVKEFGKSVPMHRPAQPEELAPSYVFLAAPGDSSYITGEVLAVYGGIGTTDA
jgi:NAD(P)-dependent dehydrogenase (short-subunit alcohol dehydrogenase family)